MGLVGPAPWNLSLPSERHWGLGALVPSAVNEAAGLDNDDSIGNNSNNTNSTNNTNSNCCALTLGHVSGTVHVLISSPEGSAGVYS